jgi:hypothetical protein
MNRKTMIADLIYNDIYGDRDEFLKRILKQGWLGYDNWNDETLTEACKMFGLLEENVNDDAI